MAGFDQHRNLSISTVVVPPSPPTTGTSLTVAVVVAVPATIRLAVTAPPIGLDVQRHAVDLEARGLLVRLTGPR